MTEHPTDATITPEMVEAACFNWLRTLFPARASDDEIRSRITDTDRAHVRYVLEAALPLAMNAARTTPIDDEGLKLGLMQVRYILKSVANGDDQREVAPVAVEIVESVIAAIESRSNVS